MADAETGSPAEQAWRLWSRLTALFPMWSFAASGLITPGAWTMLGVDFLRGVRANRSTRAASELIRDVSPAAFDALTALAAINARRHERVFRVIVVIYLTVPVTALATWGELAPAAALAYLGGRGRTLLIYVAVFALSVAVYFAGWWRSRQIVDVLDLIRVERDAGPFTALELRED